MDSVSVVILNWKRLENLKRIVDVQTKYRCVSEIIVFNNNPETPVTHDNSKVKIVNSSLNFGVFARWSAGTLATSNTILFQDDDLLLPEITVLRMAQDAARDPKRIYGIVGRNIVKGQYTPRDVDGVCDIVLTRALVIHRTALPAIILHHRKFMDAGYSLPKNNGEDIFMNLAMRAEYNTKPVALVLPWKELQDNDALSRQPSHIEERTRILRDCEQFFKTKK
jgi:hypothetical protein